MQYLCFDVGYSTVKTDLFMMPAVVGTSRKIRYQTGLGSDNIMFNLKVKVNEEEYFVGELAKKQSDQVFYSLDEDRYKSVEANVLLETVLGLMAGGGEEVGVVTGLPLDYLKHKESLQAKLNGTHVTRINGVKKITHVKNAIVLPQPMGVFFDRLMDRTGNIVNNSYANSTVGIVDIGFGSTDIAYVKNMEFIDKYSKSTDIALNSVFKSVGEAIYQEFGITKELYELENEVLKETIRIKGQEYDVSSLIDSTKKSVANKLIAWISTIWKNQPEIDEIIIAGGGGIALYPYLKKEIDSKLADNPQLAILNGYEKLSKRLKHKQ